MEVIVKKWGNSAAVRIPAAVMGLRRTSILISPWTCAKSRAASSSSLCAASRSNWMYFSAALPPATCTSLSIPVHLSARKASAEELDEVRKDFSVDGAVKQNRCCLNSWVQ